MKGDRCWAALSRAEYDKLDTSRANNNTTSAAHNAATNYSHSQAALRYSRVVLRTLSGKQITKYNELWCRERVGVGEVQKGWGMDPLNSCSDVRKWSDTFASLDITMRSCRSRRWGRAEIRWIWVLSTRSRGFNPSKAPSVLSRPPTASGSLVGYCMWLRMILWCRTDGRHIVRTVTNKSTQSKTMYSEYRKLRSTTLSWR